MKYVQVFGIVTIAMIVFSFIMVLVIPNFLIHSTIVMIFSYGLLGYLASIISFSILYRLHVGMCIGRHQYTIFPFLLRIPMLFEPDIALFSFVNATAIAIASVFIFRKVEARRAHS